ncbi:NVL family protein [Megaselia abdita]
MTRSLQERFPEYSRRKFSPFRALVNQAYRIVSQSYGLGSCNSSDNEMDGSDIELTDTHAQGNQMNNMMSNLYSKPKVANASNVAIDISSDESDDSENKNGCQKNVTSTASSSKQASNTNISSSKKQIGQIGSTTVSSVQNNSSNVKRGISPKPDQKGAPLKKRRYSGESSPKRNEKRSDNAVSMLASINNRPRPKKYKKEIIVRKSRNTFEDIGGMEKILKELCELLMHLRHPELYLFIGLAQPRGILLHGPPGCGKTLLARAIAGQLGIALIEIPATELIAGVSGESEERIREVFEQAAACAPCVLFIDEIDAISSNRVNASKDMERRIVSQLISCLDGLAMHESGDGVLVIGSTTRPDVLDPGLRRVGRFDHEISIGIPDRRGRKEILLLLTESLCLEPGLDFDKLAEITPGYVGADLLALTNRAATMAIKRKCMEQIRIYQARSRKNMTIVDLVDDAPEKPDETPSSKENLEDKSENKEAEDISNEAEKMEVEDPQKDNTEKSVAEISDEKKETPSTSEPEVNIEPPKQSNGEAIVLDDLDEEDLKNLPEPTLFQLVNWLEALPFANIDVQNLHITMDDLKAALKVVQPSAKREGFLTVPDVTWDDIGSLQEIREELKLAVLAPVKFPEKMEKLGLSSPSGVLLCGPPGCGKTLLAKAVANEAGINFISVKGPELMNMYVGESERAVRTCFQRARNSTPCVIFFDEFDSLCPKRAEGGEGSGSGTRVVNQLLTEMDGVEERKGVFLMAATNRPDIIDPAILRPGRLDKILYVGLPEQKDRQEILEALTKKGTRPQLSQDVDLVSIAEKSAGFTGADLAGLVRQAALLSLKESIAKEVTKDDDISVSSYHFNKALKILKPSVGPEDRKVYEKLRLKYSPRA